jgi:hypothetical protein
MLNKLLTLAAAHDANKQYHEADRIAACINKLKSGKCPHCGSSLSKGGLDAGFCDSCDRALCEDCKCGREAEQCGSMRRTASQRMTCDLMEDCKNAIKDIVQHTSGYGNLWVHPDGRVWFATFDGDESDYVDKIRKRLEAAAGKDKVTIEAECGPPEWREVKWDDEEKHRVGDRLKDDDESERRAAVDKFHEDLKKLLNHND